MIVTEDWLYLCLVFYGTFADTLSYRYGFLDNWNWNLYAYAYILKSNI